MLKSQHKLMSQELYILSFVVPFLIIGFFIWNDRRKKKKQILHIIQAESQVKWEFSNSFHQRAIGKYRDYIVAIGVNNLNREKSIIVELFIEFPTKRNLSIKNTQVLTFREDKKLKGIWIGEYLKYPSNPTPNIFNDLIERIEMG